MTKKALRVVIFFAVTIIACSTAWGAKSLFEEMKRAKKENKSTLVYFFSKYCGYCTEMERDVLSNREISTILKRDIVYLDIDVDKDTNVAMQYGVRGYPTTVLMDEYGNIIARIPGYIPRK